ncbi:MAG: menaquinone-dependent protoporphyrinogen IX dehydrogenase [Duodenibacillus sp.]|nr:menaquinone-dependent protoporphyrinogen IX dehydrogenase [Duodenibacillus sp.]
MKHVLMAYYSHAGHTSRIARTIMQTIIDEGHSCDMVEMMEAVREGVDWDKYDIVIVGTPIVYGVYNRVVWEFVSHFKQRLERTPSSFFNVTVVARNAEKATPEGNRYLQRFIARSPWKPRDLKCFAGKVDYPNWNWFEVKMIQLIMLITRGPTDPTRTIDYTDWDEVRNYARHCLKLDELQGGKG